MKIKLILLIFILFNLNYLETNAVCTRSNFNNNEEYSSYLNGEGECNGKKIYSDITEKTDDMLKKYKVIEKANADIKKKKEQLESQKVILDQIEAASRGEGGYADLDTQIRQVAIDALYNNYEDSGGDANGWFGSNNLEEARQDLADRAADLSNKEKEIKINQQNLDNTEINFGKDVEQLSENIVDGNQYIQTNKSDLTHNKDALSDIEGNIESLKKAESNLKKAESNLEEAEGTLEEANNNYNNADEGYNKANQRLNELNSNLEDAINNGASVEEIENLKTEIFNTETDRNAEELKKSVELKKKQKAEAEKQKLDELKDRKKKAEEAIKACENDPENCKKVYSDKQIKKVKEKIKKAKEVKEAAAQKVIDKKIVKVKNECEKGDTVACREAIVEMNKAKTKKSCIDSTSQACKDAKVAEKAIEQQNIYKNSNEDNTLQTAATGAETDKNFADSEVKDAASSPPSVNCYGLPGCYDKNVSTPGAASIAKNSGINKVSNLIGNLIQFVAVFAVIALMLSGVMYLISGGDEEKVKKAKSWITWSLVGVILSVSAWGIINMLNNLVIK